MSIYLQVFDSKFKDSSSISSKNEANQPTATQVQDQQNRILKQISFLFYMSYFLSLSLSTSILKHDLDDIHNENAYSFKYFAPYLLISQACVSIFWGFVSDRIGRKKALNISLIGSALCIALYGFFRSFSSLAFINILLGIFSCSSIFIKTMVGESNCKESRPKAFSSLTITLYIASYFGVYVSNFLCETALDINTPSIAGFPFLIPSLLASVIPIAAYIISYRYLEETLPDKRSNLNGHIVADIPSDQKMILEKSKNIRVFGLKFSENSVLLLTVSFLLNLIYYGYSIITQDWPTMDLSKGGLNLKYEYTLVFTPLLPIVTFTILQKYPYTYKNTGALKLFKAGFPVIGVLFALSLMLTLFARTGSTFNVLSLYAILYSIKSGITTLTDISFNLLLAESAEISGNLGTLYGVSSIISKVVPLLVPYIFKPLSYSFTENNLPFPLNYKLTWLLVVLYLIGYWLSSKIKYTVK